MDYSELKTAIQDYCQVDETVFNTHIDDFIRGAEDKIFMAIQMPAFWKSDSTLITVDGDSEYESVAGVVDIFSVRIGEAAVAEAEVVEDGPVGYLLRKDYDFMLEAYPGSSLVFKGKPKYYAVSSAGVEAEEGGNPTLSIRLGPIPDAIYPVTIDYYGKTAADSITVGVITTETWLSVTAPNALLYGSLIDAYTFLKGEPDIIQTCLQMFQAELTLLKNLGEGRQPNDSFRDIAIPASTQ